MVEHGIKPCYVFDGKPPDLKSGVVRIIIFDGKVSGLTRSFEVIKTVRAERGGKGRKCRSERNGDGGGDGQVRSEDGARDEGAQCRVSAAAPADGYSSRGGAFLSFQISRPILTVSIGPFGSGGTVRGACEGWESVCGGVGGHGYADVSCADSVSASYVQRGEEGAYQRD